MKKILLVLSATANTSKGSKSFVEWTEYKKEKIKVDETFRQEMIENQKNLKIELQEQINNYLKGEQ